MSILLQGITPVTNASNGNIKNQKYTETTDVPKDSTYSQPADGYPLDSRSRSMFVKLLNFVNNNLQEALFYNTCRHSMQIPRWKPPKNLRSLLVMPVGFLKRQEALKVLTASKELSIMDSMI
ncbi:hypothetical protein LIER_14903 [Lithospermum erythrorhizon]|uniref:Uncharacterized protein n=1 Tax=Lithospermum erythrorhizon TaxID=34254 RepID=A0AAV3Q2R1_LITER